MNRKQLSAYGQEFEDDDEEGLTVSKKPTQIHEEIATDEKGKRRFHGAFTGGFSAGYWNTVGSKQGWVPQVFSSSKDARGDKIKQRAEDFMDAEDLGEYGIGSRSIKQTSAFGDGESSGQKRKLAWERDSASVSTITQMFEDVVKPVSNSIGVRMLRSMGWREGRGIGLANTKQKQNRGGLSEEAQFDREQASKIAPSYEFANEDALVKQLTPLTGSHGIGYQGLRQTTVLDESYGRTALALKDKKNSKGIKGQAFGVGAFEEEDESVYSNYDLSQFDFSLDVAGTSGESDLKTQRVDTAFELQPKRLNPRKFYAPPRVPPNFRGDHKPISMDVSKLPQMMKEDVKKMTAVQRAKFLGEDRVNALEINGTDNKKPAERRSRWDIKANEVEQREASRGGEADEERDRRQRNRVEFPEEPMRQARFKEFLHYIRRGLPYPQPTDLTVWEWEWEKKEFESKLTSEERGMLPEVQSRAQPLAKTVIAAPIHEMMASKFVKETGGDLKVGTKDEDKLAAVKMEMFGDRTRQSFEWYPDVLLAKRFNVPHPFPGCDMVGVPALQKSNWKPKETLADIGGVSTSIGLPNTANEIEMRERLLKTRARRVAEEKKNADSDEEIYEDAEKDKDLDEEDEKEEKKEEKAPQSFFDVIFGDNQDSEDSDDSEAEREEEEERKEALKKREEEARQRKNDREKQDEEKRKQIQKDLKKWEEKEQAGARRPDDDDDIQVIEEISKAATSYGPALPPKVTLSKDSVLQILEKSIKKKSESRKKHKKDRKHSKKSKKSKKEKKRKRRSSSSGSSDDSDDWQEKK